MCEGLNLISSDTNVWIDFLRIDKLELPFLLPYKYLMFHESITKEMAAHEDKLDEKAISYGLQPIEITDEELILLYEFAKYSSLSVADRIALAVAKNRKIILLSGDGPLRAAANNENVQVIGTIRIVDDLFSGGYITREEYHNVLKLLIDAVKTKGMRLPINELENRIKQLEGAS